MASHTSRAVLGTILDTRVDEVVGGDDGDESAGGEGTKAVVDHGGGDEEYVCAHVAAATV